MSTHNPARQPSGIPVGGQFAPMQRNEAALCLSPGNEWNNADGTVWETDYEDEYSHTLVNVDAGLGVRVTSDIRDDQVRWRLNDQRRDEIHFTVAEGTADTLEEAQAAAKAAREAVSKYGSTGLDIGDWTPRGPVRSIHPLGVGFDVIAAGNHGYYKLSDERNAEVHSSWRKPDGLYDEDTSWSVAVLSHPDCASPKMLDEAHFLARRYYPREYTEVISPDPARYGLEKFQPITEDESFVLAEENFWAARADTHISIVGVEDDDRFPGFAVTTVSNPPKRWADQTRTGTHTILIPRDEYYQYFADGNRGAIPRDHQYRFAEDAAA